MARVTSIRRSTAVALVLGVATLLTNLSTSMLSPAFVRPGDIFLFLSAGSLGISGALITLASGLLPETFTTGEYLHFIRMFSLVSALGFCATRFPRIPQFFVSLGLWTILFGPLLLGLQREGPQVEASLEGLGLSGNAIVLYALSETMLVLMSGALLLNKTIWATLAQNPRHTSATNLFTHVITLTTASLSVLSLHLLGNFDQSLSSIVTCSTWVLAAISLVALCAPTLIAARLSTLIRDNYEELFSKTLLSDINNKKFSGQASEYWKRKSSESIPDPLRLTSTQMTSLGIVPPDLKNADGTKKKNVLNQGICALNRDGTITFVNRRFIQFADIKSNETLGKRIDQLGISPALCALLREMLEATFVKGPRAAETKVEISSLGTRFLEISSMHSDAFESATLGHGPDSVIISIRDITDRRTIEAHLIEAQKIRSLGNLVASVSHSFTNALTAIMGHASLALRLNEKVSAERSFQEIIDTAKSANEKVRQLTEFAEGKRGQSNDCNLSELLSKNWHVITGSANPESELIFKKSEQPIFANCDESFILQALTNLVENASDAYLKKAGSIEIALSTEELDEDVAQMQPGSRAGKFARIRVSDKGCGMNQEVLARACDPLFTTKATLGRSGLGLSVTFAAVRANNGFLTVESKPEKGTSVTIYLPLCESHAHAEASQKATEATPCTSVEKSIHANENTALNDGILVVEDDHEVRNLVVKSLSSLGYKVTSFANGCEALEAAKDRSFSLILADFVMPKMGGLELIKRLRSSKPETRALLMTGYGNNIETEEITTLSKPFDLDTLANAVKSSLLN